MSTLAVVEAILRNAAVPLSVREIVERAGDTLPTKSKTPDTVVARDLSMDIKKKGEASLFMRTSPGRYAIREQVLRQQTDSSAAAVYAPVGVPTGNGQVATDSPPTPINQSISGERAGTRPATRATTNTDEMSA
ncbi:MAG TPA: HTH domain-containing protein [Kofleriaceae bacterium]|jgi:hypothetical protein|nr:HTH domain-containing protein [Kofleriaceae bacterium]